MVRRGVFSVVNFIYECLPKYFDFLFQGRFLSSMLEIVMRWHKDKKIYEKVNNEDNIT